MIWHELYLLLTLILTIYFEDRLMNKLFEMFDRYVEEKIIAKTNELEGLQIRDANRIAALVLSLSEEQETLEDFEYRISQLECSMDDKAGADETETAIDNALYGIEDMVKNYVDTALVGADLGDIDSCEVERIVRCVLDEIEFKVTMER